MPLVLLGGKRISIVEIWENVLRFSKRVADPTVQGPLFLLEENLDALRCPGTTIKSVHIVSCPPESLAEFDDVIEDLVVCLDIDKIHFVFPGPADDIVYSFPWLKVALRQNPEIAAPLCQVFIDDAVGELMVLAVGPLQRELIRQHESPGKPRLEKILMRESVVGRAQSERNIERREDIPFILGVDRTFCGSLIEVKKI